MRYHLKDKVAVVTGSTAGLGREMAVQLVRAGAKVVLNGRDAKKLSAFEEELKREGYDVTTAKGDVSISEDCSAIVEKATGTYGRIDILINNAGVGSAGPFGETTPETFEKVFRINTLGTIYMTRFCLPHLVRGKGSVVFISSIAALTGVPYSSLYSASKMALTAIGQGLEVELKGTGVHVGIAYIGFLDNGPEKRVIGPEGQMQHTGDRTGYRLQSMEDASRQILRMIMKRKRISVMSVLGKSLYLTSRFAPGLVRLVKKRSLERARISYEPVPKS